MDTADTNSALALMIEDAQRGDRDAMCELMGLVRERALRWCRRRVTAWEERSATAEDIAQEACLAVLIMLPRRRWDDGSFWPMVHGVVRHKVVDVQRRVGRSRDEPCAELPDTVDALTVGPEDGAVSGENARHLAGLLSVLPESYRTILWLRLGLGLSADEVAVRFGCTAGAIRVRQHRGLTRLRRHIAATHAADVPVLIPV